MRVNRTTIRAAAAVAAAVAGGTTVAVVNAPNPPKYTFGVDFGWGGPSVGAMQRAGAKFGASYLSYDYSKNWQNSQIRAYHAAGIATVNVWETGSTRALAGYSAGRSDAYAAAAQAANTGEPANRPIYFAVDCDCSGGSVASYFSGVRSVLGVHRTGVYAGYYPTRYLFNNGLIGYAWQTYAWSGGNWDPRAQLRQYSNSHLVGGRDTDYDQGVRADYGQWPYGGAPAPKPKPVDRYRLLDTRKVTVNHRNTTERNAVVAWDTNHCARANHTCRTLRVELKELAALIRNAAYSEPTSPAGFGVSHPDWKTRHRAERYQILQRRIGRG